MISINDVRSASRPPFWIVAVLYAVIGGFVLTLSTSVRAQTFSTGSDGSDGALSVVPNLGTILFDPNETARWGRVLDADGDGVFNFTTVNIGSGTTVRFTADKMVRSVYWLASGDVVISGVLDLRGSNAVNGSDLGGRRQLAIPGPGGFAGGAGGLVGGVGPTPGDGPGGGESAVILCSGGALRCGAGGRYAGNRYLISLIGGSGGGGALWTSSYFNGGAGGGAILIASSTSISFGVNSAIVAVGGNTSDFPAGGGSGGAIRLVAPTINSAGTLNVSGGAGGNGTVTNGLTGAGGAGVIRLERFTQIGGFNIQPNSAVAIVGSPVTAETLRPLGQVRVTAVAGIPVLPTASGSFVVPDVSISNAGAVPVDIEATGIPSGTVVTLHVYPQTPDDGTIINLPPVQATLSGTTERSTATINFVFPYGFSRGTLRATWQ